MSVNDRVEVTSGDIVYSQLAPSQLNRIQFYPGKAVSCKGDLNFEKDFRIPTGTPAFDGEAAGPVEMQRTRVVKLGRNTVSDQTLLAPVVNGVRIESKQENGVCGTNVTTDTENPPNLADRERVAGNDNIAGA
jgi:hypothetical protein